MKIGETIILDQTDKEITKLTMLSYGFEIQANTGETIILSNAEAFILAKEILKSK